MKVDDGLAKSWTLWAPTTQDGKGRIETKFKTWKRKEESHETSLLKTRRKARGKTIIMKGKKGGGAKGWKDTAPTRGRPPSKTFLKKEKKEKTNQKRSSKGRQLNIRKWKWKEPT